MHLYGCLARDQFLPFDKTLDTAKIFMFLRSIVINLSMRIRFRVIYKNYVIFFLHLSLGLPFSVANAKPNNFLTWHQIRHYEAETTPLVLSCVCNKRLLSATARHAGKRPSEQFAVSFLQTIYLKKKRVNFTQERVLLSLN